VGVVRRVLVEQDELAPLDLLTHRAVLVARQPVFSRLEKTSLRTDTSLTSLCLVTTQ